MTASPTPSGKGPLDAALTQLKAAIVTLHPKTQSIITEWLIKWSQYIIREKRFDPQYLPYFKRGDIVYVDLGFNIGSEHGGVHYAVVYETNNSKKNKNVIVVPLSSINDGETVCPVDLYLGDNIIPWTPGVKTIAKPNQVRSISKMRIIKPLLAKDKTARLQSEHLDSIDNRLKEILLRK